jgi:hypothetical protein
LSLPGFYLAVINAARGLGNPAASGLIVDANRIKVDKARLTGKAQSGFALANGNRCDKRYFRPTGQPFRLHGLGGGKIERALAARNAVNAGLDSWYLG